MKYQWLLLMCLSVLAVWAGAELKSAGQERSSSSLTFSFSHPHISQSSTWSLQCGQVPSAACQTLEQTELDNIEPLPQCMSEGGPVVEVKGVWRGEQIYLALHPCDQHSWENALPLMLSTAPSDIQPMLVIYQ